MKRLIKRIIAAGMIALLMLPSLENVYAASEEPNEREDEEASVSENAEKETASVPQEKNELLQIEKIPEDDVKEAAERAKADLVGGGTHQLSRAGSRNIAFPTAHSAQYANGKEESLHKIDQRTAYCVEFKKLAEMGNATEVAFPSAWGDEAQRKKVAVFDWYVHHVDEESKDGAGMGVGDLREWMVQCYVWRLAQDGSVGSYGNPTFQDLNQRAAADRIWGRFEAWYATNQDTMDYSYAAYQGGSSDSQIVVLFDASQRKLTFSPRLNLQKVDENGKPVNASFCFKVQFKTENTGWTDIRRAKELTADPKGRSSFSLQEASDYHSLGGSYPTWQDYVKAEKNVYVRITETKAPKGYALAKEPVVFHVSLSKCRINGTEYTLLGEDDGSSPSNWRKDIQWTKPDVNGVYVLSNVRQTFLSLKKVGSDGSAISNVQFIVYECGNADTGAGGYKRVGVMRTDDSGTATMENLKVGARYVVKEDLKDEKTLQALEKAGFSGSDNWYFSTKLADANGAKAWNNRWRLGLGKDHHSPNTAGDTITEIINYGTDLRIKKVDSNGKVIEGVAFAIYTAKPIKKVATIRTGADGIAKTTGQKLPFGRQYIAVEQLNDAETIRALSKAKVKGSWTWMYSKALLPDAAKNDQWSCGRKKDAKNFEFDPSAPYNSVIVNQKNDSKRTLNIVKTSENAALTEDNPNYSLAGAKFGIYTDAACQNEWKVVTTDEFGTVSVTDIPQIKTGTATYYIKELKAPKGYTLCKNDKGEAVVKSVSFSAADEDGIVRTVSFSDPPIEDVDKIAVQKIAKHKTKLSMEGAEFTVKYYTDIISGKNPDPAAANKKVAVKDGQEAVWIMKADKDGYIDMEDAYKVSGPAFWKDHEKVAWEIGTMTIQETKAPDGFAINPDMVVTQFTEKRNAEDTESYLAPITKAISMVNGKVTDIREIDSPFVEEQAYQLPEPTVNLKLYKKDAKGKELAKAVFIHEFTSSDNQTTKDESLVCDQNGVLSLFGLQCGTHRLYETKAPAHFQINKNALLFTVHADGTVDIDADGLRDKTVLIQDENGKDIAVTTAVKTVRVDLNQKPDCTMTATMIDREDEKLPFDLQILKTNDQRANMPLAGAEFTLYSDSALTKSLANATTDAGGHASFTGLQQNTLYYLTETKAPAGYEIARLQNGSAVIYQLKVEKEENRYRYTIVLPSEAADEAPLWIGTTKTLTYYSDDKTAQTDAIGSVSLQDEKKLTVKLHVIDPVNAKLPATGSSRMLLLLIVGGLLMSAAALLRERKAA